MTNYKDAKGWLTGKEREFLYYTSNHYNSILNIGVEYGASIYCLEQDNPEAIIYGIDLIGDEKMVFNVGENTTIFRADSHDINWIIYVDFTFIDGDHDFDGVYQDAVKYSQFTNDIICFHDCANSPVADEVNGAVSKWYNENREDWAEGEQVDSIRVFYKI